MRELKYKLEDLEIIYGYSAVLYYHLIFNTEEYFCFADGDYIEYLYLTITPKSFDVSTLDREDIYHIKEKYKHFFYEDANSTGPISNTMNFGLEFFDLGILNINSNKIENSLIKITKVLSKNTSALNTDGFEITMMVSVLRKDIFLNFFIFDDKTPYWFKTKISSYISRNSAIFEGSYLNILDIDNPIRDLFHSLNTIYGPAKKTIKKHKTLLNLIHNQKPIIV